jgi:hypothetical protein
MRSHPASSSGVSSATADAAALPTIGSFEGSFGGEPSAATVDSTLTTEHLFNALDGRWITAAGDQWRAEVYGVLEEGGWRWLQVGLHGPRNHMITFRTAPTSAIGEVIQALTAWLSGSDPGPDIVSIV